MPNGADAQRRTDRGRGPHGQVAAFTDEQRIWLLERDLDDHDDAFEQFRREVRTEMTSMRHMVSTRLNWLVGLGFSLLIAVISVLVTVQASR